jgi:hypothetical protein
MMQFADSNSIPENEFPNTSAPPTTLRSQNKIHISKEKINDDDAFSIPTNKQKVPIANTNKDDSSQENADVRENPHTQSVLIPTTFWSRPNVYTYTWQLSLAIDKIVVWFINSSLTKPFGLTFFLCLVDFYCYKSARKI